MVPIQPAFLVIPCSNSTIPCRLRVCKNSVLSYTKCRSENGLVLLLWCTELTKHLHHGIWQHVTFTLLPCTMSFYHGQILIETETDSWDRSWDSSGPLCHNSLLFYWCRLWTSPCGGTEGSCVLIYIKRRSYDLRFWVMIFDFELWSPYLNYDNSKVEIITQKRRS